MYEESEEKSEVEGTFNIEEDQPDVEQVTPAEGEEVTMEAEAETPVAEEISPEEAAARARKEAEEKLASELYEGTVRLKIASPIDLGKMSKFLERLKQVNGLRLSLVGGSASEGTKAVVIADLPTPLYGIIKEMPPVAQVVKRGNILEVTLQVKEPEEEKSPETSIII